MRQVVRNTYLRFTEDFEGAVPWMYNDKLGKTTTGLGYLVNSPAAAQALPWLRKDGSAATAAEIAAAWQAVHARQDLNPIGGGKPQFAALTSIRLSALGIAKTAMARADAFNAELVRRFPSFEQWPADAQLATLSMAWAMGPDFAFPRFALAVNASPPDFKRAAAECHIDEEGIGGTLTLRNEANLMMFLSAAQVVATGADPDRLYWPASFAASALSAGLPRIAAVALVGAGLAAAATAYAWFRV